MQVLFFFFSRGDISGASAYFKIIEKEAEESKSVVEPALAEMYLSHMLQLEDPSEALLTLNRLEEQYSLTNRTLLLDSSLGSDGRERAAGGSGDNLKVGALLYAKVVNVLLRTNKTADAKALIPLLEARNLTRKRYHTVPHLNPPPPPPPFFLSTSCHFCRSVLHKTAQQWFALPCPIIFTQLLFLLDLLCSHLYVLPSISASVSAHIHVHIHLLCTSCLPAVGSSHVHLFMSQELRMGSAKGAVEAFGTFFPDIGERERERESFLTNMLYVTSDSHFMEFLTHMWYLYHNSACDALYHSLNIVWL